MCDSTLTCYNSGIDTRDMPNKHLEHLEDSIFDGRRAALRALKQVAFGNRVSVKWDGAPAIVFGTNPDNGRFFVGTKSVFNKVKIKINYSHADIDQNHKGNVADILRLCLDHLPRISGIVQADWIGYGGGRIYCPNTIEYRFASPISQKIILAPHTSYSEISPTAVGNCGVDLPSTQDCFFVNTNNAILTSNFVLDVLKILPQIPTCRVAHAAQLKQHINKFVRAGSVPSAGVLYTTLPAKYKSDVNLQTFRVWEMISQLKQRLLDAIVTDGNVECFIDGKTSSHEGYVIISDNPYKIVDRLSFSKANFNLSKNW